MNFKFPIDKDWNSKYLYVIGLVETEPANTNSNPDPSRLLLDAAVDRVPVLTNANTHTQIQLDISHNYDFQKCQKVEIGTTNNITFKVENPNSTAVTADLFIDSTNSVFNG